MYVVCENWKILTWHKRNDGPSYIWDRRGVYDLQILDKKYRQLKQGIQNIFFFVFSFNKNVATLLPLFTIHTKMQMRQCAH